MIMKYRCLLIMAMSALLFIGCDVKPAEEFVEDTGASNFIASFETAVGVDALWSTSDKLLVIDSEDVSHRFDLDAGSETNDGEFSGILSPKSSVKYVVYSSNLNDVSYDKETSEFTMEIPSVYNARKANSLVTANNAAIGVLSGSEVNLKSVCGFVKFTLEPNGRTLDVDGVTYNLTDLKEVTLKADDGKSLAGKVTASWKDGEVAPAFVSIEDGSSSVTFRTRTISTPDGNIYYEAGDYYITVAPQNYEKVSVVVEDADGNRATAVKDRALNVRLAAMSDLNTISWPTIVISVYLKSSSATESATHKEINAFPLAARSVDRERLSDGFRYEGTSKKQTVVDFTENGVTYQLWATHGYGKNEISSKVLGDLVFNYYSASQSVGGEACKVGSPDGYAWIRIPEYNGVLYKMEVEIMSGSQGPFNISTEVDPVTGKGKADVAVIKTTQKSAFKVETIGIPDPKPRIPYYICMGEGYWYRVRSWKCYYKVFEE